MHEKESHQSQSNLTNSAYNKRNYDERVETSEYQELKTKLSDVRDQYKCSESYDREDFDSVVNSTMRLLHGYGVRWNYLTPLQCVLCLSVGNAWYNTTNKDYSVRKDLLDKLKIICVGHYTNDKQEEIYDTLSMRVDGYARVNDKRGSFFSYAYPDGESLLINDKIMIKDIEKNVLRTIDSESCDLLHSCIQRWSALGISTSHCQICFVNANVLDKYGINALNIGKTIFVPEDVSIRTLEHEFFHSQGSLLSLGYGGLIFTALEEGMTEMATFQPTTYYNERILMSYILMIIGKDIDYVISKRSDMWSFIDHEIMPIIIENLGLQGLLKIAFALPYSYFIPGSVGFHSTNSAVLYLEEHPSIQKKIEELGQPEVVHGIRDVHADFSKVDILVFIRSWIACSEEEATKVYENALFRFRKDNNFHMALVQALVQNKSNQEAIKVYKSVICVRPEDKILYQNLAGLFIESGEQSQAINLYKTAISDYPDNYTFYSLLILLLIELGKKEEAGIVCESFFVKINEVLLDNRLSYEELNDLSRAFFEIANLFLLFNNQEDHKKALTNANRCQERCKSFISQ